MTKLIELTFLFLLTVCICSFNLLAQTSEKTENSPDDCEIISLKLDVIGDKFNKIAKEGSFLIIIGNSPVKVKAHYNHNRISDAVKYLVKFHKIKKEKIVFAIGSPSLNKFVYLKFYVKGELVDKINTLGKARLCFGMGETFN